MGKGAINMGCSGEGGFTPLPLSGKRNEVEGEEEEEERFNLVLESKTPLRFSIGRLCCRLVKLLLKFSIAMDKFRLLITLLTTGRSSLLILVLGVKTLLFGIFSLNLLVISLSSTRVLSPLSFGLPTMADEVAVELPVDR